MLARLLAGAGQQACGVGRQAFCAAAVATHHRGRVVGLLGGVSRIGGIAGPLIGGFIAQQYGFRAAFMLQARSLRTHPYIEQQLADTTTRYTAAFCKVWILF